MVKNSTRIVCSPDVMDGKSCIRGSSVTVSSIVDLAAAGSSAAEILKAYPDLEAEDIREALWSAGVLEVRS
jgi:uncharacterized protein (DUF433 family)